MDQRAEAITASLDELNIEGDGCRSTKLSIKVGGDNSFKSSILKNVKVKAIRFSTLETICKALNYQPGDILECISAL